MSEEDQERLKLAIESLENDEKSLILVSDFVGQLLLAQCNPILSESHHAKNQP